MAIGEGSGKGLDFKKEYQLRSLLLSTKAIIFETCRMTI
jgi:hypothetical protein